MTKPSVSVIVVSRGRAKLLQLCLLAVSQLRYDRFEIIIVADQDGLDATQACGFADRIKCAPCDVANIAIARNIGLDLATGDVVAFLDDDSVPEPGWLFHLAEVFNDANVDAACGYVLGRNGISFQTKGQTINAHGHSTPIEIAGTDPVIRSGSAVLAIKTEGTNCAFRRSVFETLGGFDPAFAYYLDESDFNIRLGRTGRQTAIVPLAQVHHRSAASDIRKPNRMPLSLQRIGESTAIFLRKHSPTDDHNALLEAELKQHHKRLVQQMIKGNCKRRDIARLIESLKSGMRAGQKAELAAVPAILPPQSEFLPFIPPMAHQGHQCISGFRLHGKKLRQLAVASARAGHIVSLFLFSRTTLFHHVRFHPDGYWIQTGGLFGRSTRSDALFRYTSLTDRVAKESQRIDFVRHPRNPTSN